MAFLDLLFGYIIICLKNAQSSLVLVSIAAKVKEMSVCNIPFEFVVIICFGCFVIFFFATKRLERYDY